VEDLPADDAFDKYQKPYFVERTFDVDVTGGRLDIGFQGENWACSVSAIVICPVAKAAEGERFLEYAREKRRFHFNNYFKRILHRPAGDPLEPSAEDRKRGYVVFHRDFMDDLYYNDTPLKEEVGGPITGEAFSEEFEPVTLGILPLEDLGTVTITAGDLTGPAGAIPSSAIKIGYVSYRLSRVTMEGSVYTIAPRLIMPRNSVEMPRQIARLFWLTVRAPAGTKPGLYRATVLIQPRKGAASEVPLEFTVRKGTLDPVDIPAGPWGHAIANPWYGDDLAAAMSKVATDLRCFRMLRENGFTTFSGIPELAYKGFQDGKPVIGSSPADTDPPLLE
jgi:hypothetical protein